MPTIALEMVGTPLFMAQMDMAQRFGMQSKICRPHRKNPLPALLLAALGILLTACLSTTPLATAPTTQSNTSRPATLDDFWDGTARFEVEIEDTGLPMGESDTLVLGDGTWRSYLHASNQSLGVIDQCGAPVDFPGCLVIFTSRDEGKSFTPTVNEAGVPVCQIECTQCPCESRRDHIDQQQYPRVAWLSNHDQWLLTYEYRANTILRRSSDGLNWSAPAEVPMTGIWQNWLMPCRPEAAIGAHPFAPDNYDCLTGSPPGIFVDETANPPQLYLFVGLGQNPSALGCFRGPLNGPASLLRACDHNPLFTGATEYGPLAPSDSPNADAYFDFRTISSADIVHVGEHYYLFYEGVRGPGQGDQGDTQFLLGVARSTSDALDGEWELYAGNPILLKLPGNVGVGHADVVITQEVTYLYTSLDGTKRSRLRLVWQ